MQAAIIGGTGVYHLGGGHRASTVATPYGEVDLTIQTMEHDGLEIVFLPRHGSGHHTPPHGINYRANIWALKELGVSHVFAVNAVGSLNLAFSPGTVVLFNDFIDCTKSRPLTFFDGQEGVIHTSMADPYCHALRQIIRTEAPRYGLDLAGEAVYVATEGPRFETAAEIRLYQQWGADVVGMTGVPEVVLAKELGLCYAGIGIITNWGTGMAYDHRMEEIMEAVDDNRAHLTNLICHIVKTVPLTQGHCQCRQAALKI